MTPEQIYAIAYLDLDAVLQNARENKRDFPQLVAALVTWVDPSDVTHTDRTMVKWVLFGWTYGVSGEEALDRLRAAGFDSPTGRTPTSPPLQNIPVRTELGRRIRKAFSDR